MLQVFTPNLAKQWNWNTSMVWNSLPTSEMGVYNAHKCREKMFFFLFLGWGWERKPTLLRIARNGKKHKNPLRGRGSTDGQAGKQHRLISHFEKAEDFKFQLILPFILPFCFAGVTDLSRADALAWTNPPPEKRLDLGDPFDTVQTRALSPNCKMPWKDLCRFVQFHHFPTLWKTDQDENVPNQITKLV